jgi:lichenan operon transcriptional antiterminator
VSAQHERLLELLARADRPMSANELADRLGVTPRSVRNYVTALKAADPDIVVSSPDGYRLDRDAYARRRSDPVEDAAAPASRLASLLRRLVDDTDGVDVHAVAAQFHVSESTVEADLGRARAKLDGSGLTLRRTGSVVTLAGTESARRRLLGTLFREESSRNMLELDAIQREFPSERLDEFKTALIAAMEARSATINEYGLSNVLLHIAIAVDRVRRHHTLDGAHDARSDGNEHGDGIAAVLDGLVSEFFDVRLGTEDLGYLAYLVSTRAATIDPDAAALPVDELLRREDLEALRTIVVRAGSEFLVDLDDEEFLVRLALHVRNLLARAAESSYSRNPLTRSIKAGYPMTYELAVFIGAQLQRERGIRINDDEIAYIAMHVGALIEQRRKREEDVVTASIVSPAYYELHLALLNRINAAFGSDLVIEHVVTRTDADWQALPGELVITTVEPPVPMERVVLVQPFLTDADADRVRTALSRVRRSRRLARLTEELLRYFDPRLFARDVPVSGPEEAIRLLGGRMLEAGIIDQAYIDGAIEREQLSSTAFTESLAVPHALTMTATRTSIGILLTETPVDWNGSRVNVVAFIAFSESDRARFQSIFDQFVEVFSERDAVQALLRGAVDFPSFIDTLVHVMES